MIVIKYKSFLPDFMLWRHNISLELTLHTLFWIRLAWNCFCCAEIKGACETLLIVLWRKLSLFLLVLWGNRFIVPLGKVSLVQVYNSSASLPSFYDGFFRLTYEIEAGSNQWLNVNYKETSNRVLQLHSNYTFLWRIKIVSQCTKNKYRLYYKFCLRYFLFVSSHKIRSKVNLLNFKDVKCVQYHIWLGSRSFLEN